MEFQEAMVKFRPDKHIRTKRVFENRAKTETASPRRKWKFFSKSSTLPPSRPLNKEFICPISGSLMADPVIVSSGHSFERACVRACQALGFTPTLVDSSKPDFSSVIPNLALKSTILSWCKNSSMDPPKPIDSKTAEKLVRALMPAQPKKFGCQNESEAQNNIFLEELNQEVGGSPRVNFHHSATDVTRRRSTHSFSSSDDSVATSASTPSLRLTTWPSCYSSSSSSELETQNPGCTEEEKELFAKLRSPHVFEIEEAVISLRNITRTREDTRAHLCTPQLLSVLRSLIVSRYSAIQVNSVAVIVNLSLENVNKVTIVRSGIVPPLIDVLKGGFPEGQEHACGALFSLALDDGNKTAIGVLGALRPLIHMLRSDRERTRNDSALSLYHLLLIQSNRTKLVKLGLVPVLVGMVRTGHMTGRILLILCNLARCTEGRVAMLDAGAVECLAGLLRGDELDSESTRESCVTALHGLSHGGLRFKGLGKAVGLVGVLRKVEGVGSEKAREKARRILDTLKVRAEEDEEDVNWEELLELGC